MDLAQVGWALVAVGLVDLLVAVLVLGPRVPEAQRRVVVPAMAAGGVLMLIVGAALISGVF